MRPVVWLFALLIGFCIDLLLGDPPLAFHPVRLMKGMTVGLSAGLRRLCPKTSGGERVAGTILGLLVCVVSWGGTMALLLFCGFLSPWLSFAVQILLSYQLLGTRALRDTGVRVYAALRRGDQASARCALSTLTAEELESPNEEGITRAAVETVAVHTCDSVVGTLLFLAAGGAPLGMLYRSVGAMRAALGGSGEQDLAFGRFAIQLEDILSFIPARVAGSLMCFCAAPAGFDGQGALAVFRRDRIQQNVPNACHTGAACAGALQIELGGGLCADSPVIGAPSRPAEPLDILRANRLMYATAFFTLVLCCGLPLMVLLT